MMSLFFLGCFALVYGSVGAEPVSFITIGDWGDTALPGQKQVAAAMDVWAETWRPEFVVSTGDNFYPWGAFSPTDPQFDLKWRNTYNGTYTADLPWLISVGNHDYGRDRGEEWNQVEFGNTEPRWYLPHLWHDVTYEGDGFSIDLIAIDTEALRKGVNNHTEMMTWLDNRLAASQATWTIVYGHRPIYSVANYGPWSGTNDRELRPLLERYGVDVFLCGHDHNLQHLSKETDRDIDYVLSGGGGALWYAYDEEAADTLYRERGVVAHHFSMTWGFIGFVVDAESMYMEFVNTDNEVIYSYTRTK